MLLIADNPVDILLTAGDPDDSPLMAVDPVHTVDCSQFLIQ
jgi:hypothetical protein